MAKYSKLLVTTLVALGCADRKTSHAPSADASSSTGESSDPMDASDTSSDLPASSSSSGSTAGESSTGEPVAECGNAVVEAGEQCDGEPGCVDCMRTCGFAAPTDMFLNASSWTTSTRPPIAVADGTGDLIVASAAGIHRVGPDGEEQWLNTEPETTHRLWALAVADPDHVWVGWSVYGSSTVARYTRHTVTDGGEVDRFEVTEPPESDPGALLGTADGSLYFATNLVMSDMDWRARVQQRDARGMDVVWSTEVTVEMQPDGYSHAVALYLAPALDGSLLMGAYTRLDFDSNAPLLAKLGSDGSLQWQRTIESWSGNWARVGDPTALDDGGVLVVVLRQYSSAGVIGNTPGHFTRLMRLDADGTTMWEAEPTDELGDLRVQVMTIHAVDERFALGGTVVDDTGNATPWLGYIDAQGELLCSTSVAHPGGDPATMDHFFTTADGTLMVQGYADDDQPGSAATARWFAEVYPY